MHFIYFLGRFHVVVLHLPITLILVVAGLEWLNRGGRRPDLEPALNILWPVTALAALVTVILGYMHFSEGGFTGPSSLAHRALGTSVGLISLLGWWLHPRRGQSALRWVKSAVVTVLVVLIFVTGHLGGNLSHGSDFLVAYAPNWIRVVLGLQPQRARVTDIASADPYLDVVRPIFAQHCFSCHNSAKQRGGLDLSRYAVLIKGGKDGPVVVPGNAKASDMIRRVSLSPDDDDFMPKEGGTPLTADQIAILRWWIDNGARTDANLGDLHVPAEVLKLIAAQLHLAGAPAGLASTRPGAGLEVQEIALGAAGAKANPQTMEDLVAVGLMARQVSMADAHLMVSPTVPGSQFSAAQIQALASTAGGQVVRLDLRGAGVDDAGAAIIARLTDITQLRLDRNKVTDKAVKALLSLPNLQVLGLYGNPGITDVALDTIAQMKSLRRVFLWGTHATAAGVQRLRHVRPDLIVDFGDEAAPASVPTVHTNIPTA